MLICKLIICIDHLCRSVISFKQGMLLECLEIAYKVLEMIALLIVNLHLDRRSGADFEIEDGVLKVDHLFEL